AGGVRQQMPDRHRTPRRPGFVCRILLVELRDHLQVVETSQVLRYWVVELQLALFKKHHDGDGSDRFGHRCDREDGIYRHRHVMPDVRLSGRTLIDHSLSVRDERGHTGRITASYGGCESLRDGGLARFRESSYRGLRVRTRDEPARNHDERSREQESGQQSLSRHKWQQSTPKRSLE